MSDLVDVSNEVCEVYLQARIEAVRASNDPSAQLKGNGVCHNCGEHLGTLGSLFCDADCCTDYQDRIDAHHRNFGI